MTFNDTFLRSIRKEKIDHVPVWYMRQAGRYQPSYRKVKEKFNLMQITEQPELCAEVTMSPIEQLGVDAAILYSDIMTPIKPMGIDLEIKANIGPVIANPIRSLADVQAMRNIEPEQDLHYVIDTIKILRRELKVPLITFAGAPFTLASYLIEGGPSRNYYKTKQMMYSSPEIWNALMDKLAEMIVTYMKAHVAAGAQAIQIFDSWIGSLSQSDYRRYVFPTMKKIFEGLGELDVPKIYFGVGTGELMKIWSELPVDVIGVDWRVPLDQARERVGNKFALQGNLDPAYLLAPEEVRFAEAKRILDMGLALPGYVFNLGHGIFPEADVDVLKRLTDFVHEYSARRLAGHE
ncbi:MAG: uroporphyrinogen decarboxylase [Tumebacillaceae bacterium]